MLVVPAVDIKDGELVRLWQGDFEKAKSYSQDPISAAKGWAEKGARLIHVVDLDGARSGKSKNLDIAAEIAGSVSCPVELGGGIRTRGAIEEVLDRGIARVVLGTVVSEDPAFTRDMVVSFGDKVVISIDAKDGIVRAKGWSQVTKLPAVECGKRMLEFGVKTIIYTDIARDGTLMGPNIEAIERFLDSVVGLEVFASGGIASLEDLKCLKRLESKGLAGVIVGKALYEGKIDFEEAMKLG